MKNVLSRNAPQRGAYIVNVSRTWIATSLLLVIGPALARARESTSKAQTAGAVEKASRGATAKAKVPAPEGPFLVKPYLQLGHTQTPGKLVLVWQAADSDADWAVEYMPGPGTRWQIAKAPSKSRVAVAGIDPHRIYHTPMSGLEPGTKFAYRVSLGGKIIFQAEARAAKLAHQAHRFVVFGDCGAGTPEQKAIAYRAFLSRPDYVLIPGDIVYGKGLISEYRESSGRSTTPMSRRRAPGSHCSARLSSSPRRATMTSPLATWGRPPMASLTSTTGVSRSMAPSVRRAARW